MSSDPTAIRLDSREENHQIASIGNTQPLQVMSPSTTLEQLGLAGLSPDEALDRLLAAQAEGGTTATTGVGTATALPLTSSNPSSFGQYTQHADRIPMAFSANAIEPPAPATPARAPPAAAVSDTPVLEDDHLSIAPGNRLPRDVSSAANPTVTTAPLAGLPIPEPDISTFIYKSC